MVVYARVSVANFVRTYSGRTIMMLMPPAVGPAYKVLVFVC